MKNSRLYAALALLILSGAAARGQEAPRSVAVYVAGGISDAEKNAVGNALLAALVNSGAAVAHPSSAGFLANADDWSKRQVVIDDDRLCELGRYYGIKYICAASVTPAFGAPGDFTVFVRMLNTETGKAKVNGDATGPLKTAEDLALAANAAVGKMLGRRPPAPATQPPPIEPVTVAPTPPAPLEAAAPDADAPENQPAATAQADTAAPGKLAVAVYMAGKEPKNAKGAHNIIGGELARVLSESDKYTAVDRTEAILSQLDKEHVYQRSGAVDDEQIKAIGHQLGVQYLCISDINPVGKRYYLDTRLVDIVTAEIARSVTATSTLKNADEITRVGRNIALELLEADKTREQRARKKVIFRTTAICLDVLGAAAGAYGYFENSNVVKLTDKLSPTGNGPEATRAATRRNAAYIAGGALLAAGVVIHIGF